MLVSAFVLANLGAALVDTPAALLGVKIDVNNLPPGLADANLFVQDAAFVLTVVIFAQMGGRMVRSWQFGLRPVPLRQAIVLIGATLGATLLFTFAWAALVGSPTEHVLNKLGADQGTILLLLSALLTCVMAPVCEELLFRGFVFSALRNWTGTWPAALITGLLFGAFHFGSAPTLDLVPLAVLGVGLCLLYRYTGSLYPCIAAHSLNNSFAFGAQEHWIWWQIPVLMLAALAVIALLARALTRVGVITAELPPSCGAPAVIPSA